MNNDMQHSLQAYYTNALPEKKDAQISDLDCISAGWESDVYSFRLEHRSAGEHKCEELILRIYPGDDAHDKSAHEFHSMSRLHKAGYPVPQVLVLERKNSPFRKPFVIMEKIEGQLLWPLLLDAPEGDKKQELLTLFCKLFVQLHTLEWRPFVDDVSHYDTQNPYIFVDRELEKARSFLARFPLPGFLPIIEWLETRRDRVPCLRPSPVHLDFHPANVLVYNNGSAVVIDWTQLDISDARFDLAWTLLLVSTHGNAAWRDLILQEYEQLTGARMEEIAFFDVAACAKRLFTIVISFSAGPEKLGMRPEALEQMKQQMGAMKGVYDLLLDRTSIQVPEVEELLTG